MKKFFETLVAGNQLEIAICAGIGVAQTAEVNDTTLGMTANPEEATRRQVCQRKT